MTKKKDPLKKFTSRQLLEEIIIRYEEKVEELHLESEMISYDADDGEDIIAKLKEIILE